MAAMNATTHAVVPEQAPAVRITEIFLSLQGEADTVGWPTVFVRLTGCPLRCQYCDTEYAFKGGERLTLADITGRVDGYGVRHVTVTGGEPLAQPECLTLLEQLCEAGYTVSLETSGAMDVGRVDPRVIKVMDIKTPASREAHRNRWENLEHLRPADQVKFVICDRGDYEWARNVVRDQALADRCQVLFSPSYAELAPRALADWIVADRLPVRFQMQLHKILWGDEPGR
jgi:7-carboxy-7-deazaguanine synthase